LGEANQIRVIAALAVYKDADGELEVEHLSSLSTDEAIEVGTIVAPSSASESRVRKEWKRAGGPTPRPRQTT
jgi:hypothetical protein